MWSLDHRFSLVEKTGPQFFLVEEAGPQVSLVEETGPQILPGGGDRTAGSPSCRRLNPGSQRWRRLTTYSPWMERLDHRFSLVGETGPQVLPGGEGWTTGSPLWGGGGTDHMFSLVGETGPQVLPLGRIPEGLWSIFKIFNSNSRYKKEVRIHYNPYRLVTIWHR